LPAAEAQIYSRDIANRYCFICTFGGLGKHYKFAVDLFVISGSKFVIRIVDKMLHKLKSAATILAVSSQMITILFTKYDTEYHQYISSKHVQVVVKNSATFSTRRCNICAFLTSV